MAGKARKTEHAGPKKGAGAYWGRKVDAKRESNKLRRENAKRAVRHGLSDSGVGFLTSSYRAGLGDERCARSVSASCGG